MKTRPLRKPLKKRCPPRTYCISFHAPGWRVSWGNERMLDMRKEFATHAEAIAWISEDIKQREGSSDETQEAV